MNISIPASTAPLSFFILFFYIVNVNAQRLELHANKDLSTNEIATKAWGVGGALEYDQWVKKTTFRANFNWTMYRNNVDEPHHYYQRMSGGASVFYTLKLAEKITFQCGGEINYTYVKHSYIYDYEPIDSLHAKPLTTLQSGNFIGIGPHLGVRYAFGPRLSVVLNVVPTYLISIRPKSDIITLAPLYKKGIWLFPIQLGFSYLLFKSK